MVVLRKFILWTRHTRDGDHAEETARFEAASVGQRSGAFRVFVVMLIGLGLGELST
jgi:hypothetical protein